MDRADGPLMSVEATAEDVWPPESVGEAQERDAVAGLVLRITCAAVAAFGVWVSGVELLRAYDRPPWR